VIVLNSFLDPGIFYSTATLYRHSPSGATSPEEVYTLCECFLRYLLSCLVCAGIKRIVITLHVRCKHREAALPKIDVPGMTATQAASTAAAPASNSHKKLFITTGTSEVSLYHFINRHSRVVRWLWAHSYFVHIYPEFGVSVNLTYAKRSNVA